jgi:hypothetical protein
MCLLEVWHKNLNWIKKKEHSKHRRYNVHMIEYDSDSSDDENEVYVAEFVWPSKSKASSCDLLNWLLKVSKKN